MEVYEVRAGNKEKKKKKSGQIPAFGNWDYETDLPITQYFESARQAGLIRFSNVSSTADSDSRECTINAQAQCHDLHPIHFNHCSNYSRSPPRMAKVSQAKEYGRQSLMKEKKINKIDYLTELPRQTKLTNKNDRGGGANRVPPGKQKKNTNIINVKPVDEDLYKIPPHLLHSAKRKKKLGLFSRCLVPDCMV